MSVTLDDRGALLSQTQAFFNAQWHLYQKILLHNYMGHREIYDVLQVLFIAHFQHPFKMLDLGCGDASLMTQALLNTPIGSYTGIDCSEVALDRARDNLVALPASVCLIPGDFSQALPELAIAQSHSFELILASFSLHHLTLDGKDTVLEQIDHLLSSKGIFLLVDIVRFSEENRESYIERYLENVWRDWSLLSPQELEMVASHMRSSDFPETQETWCQLARKHGFTQDECLYRDPLDTTRILCLYR